MEIKLKGLSLYLLDQLAMYVGKLRSSTLLTSMYHDTHRKDISPVSELPLLDSLPVGSTPLSPLFRAAIDFNSRLNSPS